ncbi:unnamed protein product (mitochondrion) [Plasmodiophora brassicae]|uniref:Bardet-Biedl syndrome 2 protein homolog n=1 Tax=Plasmodiophora brassicae TaxID=37360 RepID=A0A3P3Y3W3_PLABS|nr:unnamed protein product [Plasmodiophora brassicae]
MATSSAAQPGSVARLQHAFALRLDVNVLPGRAVIGRFDGEHVALALANPGGTVTVHWSDRSDKPQVVRVNRDVTALAAASLSPEMPNDILLVGTPTNLMAYDLHHNKDLFFKDVADGVNAIVVRSPSKSSTPLAIVGGNCSVQGFDAVGDEKFWTVTGDNVTCLALCDADGDSSDELLVGSEDSQIRVYRNEQVIWETTEVDAISAITTMHGSCFAYALANNSVGVYDRTTRLWSAKYNARVVAIASFDLDGDGVPELVVGLSDGTVDVRLMRHGTIVQSDTMGASVAAIVVGDYRSQQAPELMVCAIDGELKGYASAEPDQRSARSVSDEVALAKMKARLAELQRELAGYDQNLAAMQKPVQQLGRIPPDTKISCALGPNLTKTALELRMSTSNDTLIKFVILFGDNVFEGESLVKYAAQPEKSITVPLSLQKNVSCDLMIKVVIGYKGSAQDHVFELSHRIPKFASFSYCKPRDLPFIKSLVTLPLKERVSRVILWLNQSFLLDFAHRNDSDSLNVGFKSMRDDTVLSMSVGNDTAGQFQIRTDDMQLAGDIIQDLCAFLSVDDCESSASFPVDFEQFEGVLRGVKEYSDLRKRLCTEMADLINLVKMLVIKGEDARLLGDMGEMKTQYSELMDTNNELIRELAKRSANHEALLGALKKVNLMIQRAARLRMGTHKTNLIQACHNAIKANSTGTLLNIIKAGHE